MAETYGKTPTEILDRPFSSFWVDAGVMAATKDWKDDVQDRRQAAQTSAGAASPDEKEALVDAQEDRAERREQADTPDPMEQMDAMGLDGVDIQGGN
jgi:hypothetical protein